MDFPDAPPCPYCTGAFHVRENNVVGRVYISVFLSTFSGAQGSSGDGNDLWSFQKGEPSVSHLESSEVVVHTMFTFRDS